MGAKGRHPPTTHLGMKAGVGLGKSAAAPMRMLQPRDARGGGGGEVGVVMVEW